MFTINCTPRYEGAAGRELLRREMAGQAAAYRTDVYEGNMITGATESRMVHLRQVIEQREFFMECVHAAGAKLEQEEQQGLLETRERTGARWALEAYRALHAT
jgi:hypothetical protein